MSTVAKSTAAVRKYQADERIEITQAGRAALVEQASVYYPWHVFECEYLTGPAGDDNQPELNLAEWVDSYPSRAEAQAAADHFNAGLILAGADGAATFTRYEVRQDSQASYRRRLATRAGK